jgi:hypothetical protein
MLEKSHGSPPFCVHSLCGGIFPRSRNKGRLWKNQYELPCSILQSLGVLDFPVSPLKIWCRDVLPHPAYLRQPTAASGRHAKAKKRKPLIRIRLRVRFLLTSWSCRRHEREVSLPRLPPTRTNSRNGIEHAITPTIYLHHFTSPHALTSLRSFTLLQHRAAQMA